MPVEKKGLPSCSSHQTPSAVLLTVTYLDGVDGATARARSSGRSAAIVAEAADGNHMPIDNAMYVTLRGTGAVVRPAERGVVVEHGGGAGAGGPAQAVFSPKGYGCA